MRYSCMCAFPVPCLFAPQVGDEPKAGANKKMKRAFCEPGNASNNPPLAIAKQLLNLLGTVEVR